MSFLKKLFGKKEPVQLEFTDVEWEAYGEAQTLALETILGPMHPFVGHAIIPFAVGGAVDMYYFPNHIPGTGFATMELLSPDGTGPLPNELGTYELVGFTRLPIADDQHPEAPFHRIERRFCGIFTAIGNYSREAVLSPHDTCEIPADDGNNICLLFDKYPADEDLIINGSHHHLLLCMEIFPSEVEYARENGTEELLEKLKLLGHYPYSDMDREPVV